MKHFKHLLKRPLQEVPIKAVALLLVLALIGFADASFLSIEHFRNAIPPCTVGSCEAVLSSAYSTIFGVPVALFGVIYYLMISIGLFTHLEGKHEPPLRWVLLLTVCGFLMSLWFVFVQAFLLHQYCLYCLGSATISTILFISAMVVFKKYQSVFYTP
jgi:uncharacterized membrane protein